MKNPLANGTMKFKKAETKTAKVNSNFSIAAHLVGMNDGIRICAEACSCCWDSPLPTEFEDVAEYVAKRTRIGHTSVLEHSNFVVFLEINEIYRDDIIEFLDNTNYLKTKIWRADNLNIIHMLVGGSYRGYADVYREIPDLNNIVLKAISEILYTYAHSAAFEDICKLGLMDKTKFLNLKPDENFALLNTLESPVETELFKIVGLDDELKIFKNIKAINPFAANRLSEYDLIQFATITILFKNMSRTCTHQLVRHRNAITQESQRYVDYSKACFNSPEIFKPEKYDANHKYTIKFGDSGPMEMTLSEIGEAICGIYGMLSNSEIAGEQYHLLKEDARSFLPSNVQCKKIYMTFTLKSFLKFLNLREDKHAQAEIRRYAVAVGEWFRSVTDFKTKELCDKYTMPRLIVGSDTVAIEEDIIEEQDIEPTLNDYMKAAGLEENE